MRQTQTPRAAKIKVYLVFDLRVLHAIASDAYTVAQNMWVLGVQMYAELGVHKSSTQSVKPDILTFRFASHHVLAQSRVHVATSECVNTS
jgi:hypothetical protein